jgi:hypothetical protein
MHKVNTRLDRVFDVLVTEDGGQRITIFSFESNGKRHFGVRAYGEPKIQSGQTITALLKQPGNWKTLEAFVIHETGEVSCWDTSLRFVICLICISGVIYYFLMIDSDIVGLWIALGAHALLALGIAWRAAQVKKIRQELLGYALARENVQSK